MMCVLLHLVTNVITEEQFAFVKVKLHCCGHVLEEILSPHLVGGNSSNLAVWQIIPRI